MFETAPRVLAFWFGSGAEYGIPHKRWFEKNAAFDARVRRRFSTLPQRLAASGAWLGSARDCLARIIVLDQFPRHLYRGRARAFAYDPLALAAARRLVDKGWDRRLLPVERMFAYLPFEHSESLADQERAVRLCEPLNAFAQTPDTHRYAILHRDIVHRFGRFPHRNAALGRPSTREEIEFLKRPGSGF
jgi:uncharacterized protein (DUF924 family)